MRHSEREVGSGAPTISATDSDAGTLANELESGRRAIRVQGTTQREVLECLERDPAALSAWIQRTRDERQVEVSQEILEGILFWLEAHSRDEIAPFLPDKLCVLDLLGSAHPPTLALGCRLARYQEDAGVRDELLRVASSTTDRQSQVEALQSLAKWRSHAAVRSLFLQCLRGDSPSFARGEILRQLADVDWTDASELLSEFVRSSDAELRRVSLDSLCARARTESASISSVSQVLAETEEASEAREYLDVLAKYSLLSRIPRSTLVRLESLSR